MAGGQEVREVGLVIGGGDRAAECWLFRWSPDNTHAVLHQIGRWAADPGLAFGWRDAAVVAWAARGILRSRVATAPQQPAAAILETNDGYDMLAAEIAEAALGAAIQKADAAVDWSYPGRGNAEPQDWRP